MICYSDFVMTKLIFEEKINSLLHKCWGKVLILKQFVLITYSNLEKTKITFIGSDQDGNCHRKSSLLNCRSLLL